MLNRVILEGRLGQDPEIRAIGDNKKLSVSMAVANPGKKKDDPNSTQWLEVELWGVKAEKFAEFFKKGSAVTVEGKIKTDSWEKEGEKRSRTIVSVDEFHFPQGGSRSESGSGGASNASPKASVPATPKEELPDF